MCAGARVYEMGASISGVSMIALSVVHLIDLTHLARCRARARLPNQQGGLVSLGSRSLTRGPPRLRSAEDKRS